MTSIMLRYVILCLIGFPMVVRAVFLMNCRRLLLLQNLKNARLQILPLILSPRVQMLLRFQRLKQVRRLRGIITVFSLA